MDAAILIVLICGGSILFCFAILLLGVICYPVKLVKVSFNLQSSRAGFVSKTVDAAGINWSYIQKGELLCTDRIIVLIHGFSSGKESWLAISKGFSNGCVLAPDLPGHGSTYPYPYDSDYCIASQVHRLNEFLNAAIGKGSQIHLVGCSMGGCISGVYAATYPERVASLSLLCPAGVSMPRKSKLISKFEESGRNLLHAKSGEELEELIFHLFHKPPRIPRWVLGWAVSIRAKKIAIFEKVFDDLVADKEILEEQLHLIQAPTLVLWGEEDQIIDVSCVEVIKEKMDSAPTISVVPLCGHCIQREYPSHCASEILQLIEDVETNK